MKECRNGYGPVFLECLTYRVREHVGPLFDYDKGYRTKSEVDQWMKRCPIKRFKRRLLSKKIISNKEVDALLKKLDQETQVAYEKVLRSPWPDPDTLLDHVY